MAGSTGIILPPFTVFTSSPIGAVMNERAYCICIRDKWREKGKGGGYRHSPESRLENFSG
jgi:hypothetical protein